MKKYATARDTEAGQLVERFLDNDFGVEDYAAGYEEVFDAINDLATEVEIEADNLLGQISDLEKDKEELTAERDELETKVTYLENIINDLEGGA